LANFVIRVGISSDTSQSEYSVFQSAEVQKLWVLGKRQEAKGKGEEKQVYLTSLGNAKFSSNMPESWVSNSHKVHFVKDC